MANGLSRRTSSRRSAFVSAAAKAARASIGDRIIPETPPLRSLSRSGGRKVRDGPRHLQQRERAESDRGEQSPEDEWHGRSGGGEAVAERRRERVTQRKEHLGKADPGAGIRQPDTGRF